MSIDFGNSSSFFGHLSHKTLLTIGVSLVVLVIVGAVAIALSSNSHPEGTDEHRQAEAARVAQAFKDYYVQNASTTTSAPSKEDRAAALARATAAAHKTATR